MRTVIIGNSGSGKSTLAIRLGQRHEIPTIHLDQLFWKPGNFSEERPKENVHTEVENLAQGEKWLAEGVYTDLITLMLPRATALIWLDFEWPVLKQSLLAREDGRAFQEGDPASVEVFERLLDWAEGYWERNDHYSWKGHSRIFDGFGGEKLRFRTRTELNAFLDAR